MSLDIDIAEYVLGILAPHELGDVCIRALEAGHESTSLAALAGMTAASYDRWEAEALWGAALRELDVVLPGKHEAAGRIVDDAVRRALRGEMAPRDAVSRIYGVHDSSDPDEPDEKSAGNSVDLGDLVGIYWMYDESDQPWSPSREQLDRDALAALRALAERRARSGQQGAFGDGALPGAAHTADEG